MTGTKACQLFLDLLPRETTVADLIYGDFYKVLDGLAKNAIARPDDPDTYRPKLAEGLEKFSEHLKSIADGKDQPVWHFYAHDMEKPPNSKWSAAKWKAAHGKYYGAAQKKIVDHFRFPFLDLGKNSPSADRSKWGRREFIADFVMKKDTLNESRYLVESQIGHIKYCDIFEKVRDHPDVCGPLIGAPSKEDPGWLKFSLIRRAFHHGIFAEMSGKMGSHTMDQAMMIPQPNGLCYSETEQDCVPMYNGFCWSVAGSPGAGSTFCS